MPRDNNAWTVANGSDQLCELADEMEQFLLVQVERFEERVRQASSLERSLNERPVGAGAMRESRSEFTANDDRLRDSTNAQDWREMEAWEAQRQAEADRLREEAALLLEAWRKCEEEQRRLLAERELIRRGLPIGERTPAIPLASSSLGSAAVDCSAEQNTTNIDEKSAWLQFQRMRREIQSRSRLRP